GTDVRRIAGYGFAGIGTVQDWVPALVHATTCTAPPPAESRQRPDEASVSPCVSQTCAGVPVQMRSCAVWPEASRHAPRTWMLLSGAWYQDCCPLPVHSAVCTELPPPASARATARQRPPCVTGPVAPFAMVAAGTVAVPVSGRSRDDRPTRTGYWPPVT